MVLAVTQAHDVIVSLIIVAIVAAVVYFGCTLVARPDLGRLGAAVVIIVGALLVLVDHT